MNEQPRGWLWEVFTSIQGEGLYCGQRHTFVRFAGCNLACDYCDTAHAREHRPKEFRYETSPGSRSFERAANPISADEAAALCEKPNAKVIALTGGEPLEQADFVESLARELRSRGLVTYLETNGTLHEAMARVVELIDIVAMDIKLPSSTGHATQWEDHELFLRIASKTSVFVKSVVCKTASLEEIQTAARLIADVDARIPLVIQPASQSPPPAMRLMDFQSAALKTLTDVRVIPQCHKLMEVL